MEWICVNYNHGNCFDGTYFTVPENGLYCFYATCYLTSRSRGRISLHVNNYEIGILASKAEGISEGIGDDIFINIYTTLELEKDDKVDVRLWGKVDYSYDKEKAYFEGRMIARLN